MDFDNLAQSTAEDRSAFTNLTTANATIFEQVPLYANCLSTKEADNVALQTAMKNLKGRIKNLKSKVSTLKRLGHSGGASNNKHNRGRSDPNWKRDG